jgi:LemA protein
MNKTVIFLAGLLVVLFVAGAVVVNGLNTVVRLDESVNSAWAQVENQLQRRNDLIPNLVNTVKGYAAQERDVLTKVTELRSQWGKAATQDDKIQAANDMTSALARLMVVVEKYPDLKSNQNFLALQSQLEGTENRIAVERMRYNEAVRVFNAHCRTVFGNVFAGMRGLKARPYFQAEESAKKLPEVKF